jgi:hypothetical protein
MMHGQKNIKVYVLRYRIYTFKNIKLNSHTRSRTDHLNVDISGPRGIYAVSNKK